ncbi:MAG: hypothetical protein ICV73_20985 [Acetobacteraceae bacterium]|nr:hypothetical protein [Acetobacteraceae bacterium]
MRHGKRALRPIASLALLGAVAGGCGLPDGHYGGGGSGYYGSPGYYRRDNHHRSSQPRTERWSQQRLQQHWREQAQKVR